MNSRILPTLALGLLGVAAAQDAPPKPTPASPTTTVKAAPVAPARGTQLLGLPLLDAQGETLGNVKDLVAQDSTDLTAVIERKGGGLVAVPLSVLAPHVRELPPEKDAKGTPTAQIEAFSFTGDAALLASAEAIAAADALDGPALERCRTRFCPPAASTPPIPPPPEKAVPPAPADKPVLSVTARPACLNVLVGTDVKDSMGENVGEVQDLAVDVGRGQLAYVVVSTGGVLGLGETHHGIALSRLTRSHDGKSASLPVSKEGLNVLKGFDLEHLPMNPDLSVNATGEASGTASTDDNS